MKFNAPRRIFLPLLCLILLVSLVPTALAASGDHEGAREAILQAYEDLAAAEGLSYTIDLEQYAITVEELKEIVTSTGRNHDCLQPWYLDNYKYTYEQDTGIVHTVTFNRMDPAVYDYALFEQTVAEILAVTVFEGMSEWQMALSIHDYLVAHCAYDESLTYREGYDALIRGTAVCSGYAEAYMYLLQRVGIDCRYVSSEEMDHAWNLVRIDGNWYHVDATWDDPTPDVQGRVRHDYFLISDQAMRDEEHDHYGWVTDIECTDTSLDADRFWQGIDGAICYESADVCYFRQQTGETAYTIYRRGRDGEQTVIATCDAGRIDIGGSEKYDYFYNNCGLTLAGGRLYYADMTAVYSVNTDGSDLKTVYSHDYSANKTYIKGCHVSGGKLYLTLSDHDSSYSTMTMDLGGEFHIHHYTPQDIAPTCSSRGCTLYSCECGLAYEAEFRLPAEHTYDEGTVVIEPTNLIAGSKCYTCTACGHTKFEEIPKLTGSSTGGNNFLSDADGVSEEEYTVRRILAGVGVVLLIVLFCRKKKK